jgi:hypothetical protein
MPFWVWIVLGLIAVIITGIGIYFSTKIIKIQLKTHEEIWGGEVDGGRIIPDQFEKLAKEQVYIPSRFGYNLHGFFVPYEGSSKTVIIVHGVTMSLYASVKYMDLFRSRGFNVLMYDHRRHGKSGGTTTTYGYCEKQDLKAWTDWVRAKFGDHCEIGILGESMGAATTLQYSEMDPGISFYILDCPYSDVRAQFAYRLKEEYKLPEFPLLSLANFFVWLRTGMSFAKVSPIRQIAHVTTPMLFIHGLNDAYVPHQMSVELYEAKQGIKKLYLVPGADHAESLIVNPKEYDRVVGAFLEDVEKAAEQHPIKKEA